MKEEWKNKLQDSLSDYEEAAPDGLWNAIEAALDNSPVPVVPQESNAEERPAVLRPARWRRPTALRLYAAAAGVACLAGLFFYLSDNDGNQSQNIICGVSPNGGNSHASAEQDGEAYAESRNANSAECNGSHVKHSVAASGNADDERLLAQAVESKDDNAGELMQTVVSSEGSSSTTEREEKRAESKPQQNTSQRKPHNDTQAVVYSTGDMDFISSRKQDSSARLTAGLYASNAVSTGNSGSSATVFSSQNLLQSDAALCTLPDQSQEIGTRTYLQDTNDDENVKHHAPVRIGVSVHYSFSKRWGIETGLAYSYLSSDIARGSSDSRHETTQKLHYVGVPVVVDYSVWQNRWARVYVAGGGMVEKCVSGKSETSYRLDGKTITTERMDVKPKELQWSLNAAAGAQFNITENLGLYLEPGVGYYINSGSEVKTAYTEKPFNFNLKLGLRYSIK